MCEGELLDIGVMEGEVKAQNSHWWLSKLKNGQPLAALDLQKSISKESMPQNWKS